MRRSNDCGRNAKPNALKNADERVKKRRRCGTKGPLSRSIRYYRKAALDC